MSNVGHEWVIRIGIRQQGADREQDLGDSECGAPLLFENVEADATVRVDVRVVDPRREVQLWRLERVVTGENNVEEVDATGVRAVFRTHDSCLPLELILLIDGTS